MPALRGIRDYPRPGDVYVPRVPQGLGARCGELRRGAGPGASSRSRPDRSRAARALAAQFRDAARSILGVELDSRDEIDCLVKGMAFLMAHVAAETYTWHGDLPVDRPMDAGIQYPYLLVNVGSGVSFILVRGEHAWERVSGTSVGGEIAMRPKNAAAPRRTSVRRLASDIGSFGGAGSATGFAAAGAGAAETCTSGGGGSAGPGRPAIQ